MFYPKTKGFTLVELLIAVSIMLLVVSIFTQLFVDKFERSHLDNEINNLLTLNRAITLFYIENDKLWPGQANQLDTDCDFPDVVNDLTQDFLPYFKFTQTNGNNEQVNKYSFDCSNSYFTIETQTINNNEDADYLAMRLPIATEAGGEVQVFIPKPRTSIKPVFESSPVDNQGYAYFNKPQGCTNPQISVSTDRVCVSASDKLGGYHIVTEDYSNGSAWRVHLNARNDEGSSYNTIIGCDGGPVTFSAIKFCLD